MATGLDLEMMLRSVRNNLEKNGAKLAAQEMYQQTMENFEKEQYANDGRAEKWADRYFYEKGKTGDNAERFLRYKKLNYTGNLKKSAKPVWGMTARGRAWAGVQFSAPYAKMHNEGVPDETGGNSFRRPPKSTKPIRLGTRPYKRQFAGVGSQTYIHVWRAYARQLKRLV